MACTAYPREHLIKPARYRAGAGKGSRYAPPQCGYSNRAAVATNATPGESDILIKTERTSSYRLNAAVDDAGSDSTGKYQSILILSLGHWWSLNDLFYLTINL